MYAGRISNERRIQLYKKAWETPVMQLAKREGISAVAMRKRLKRFDIPLPPRGYWAKSESKRKEIRTPELPEVSRELSDVIFGYAIHRTDSGSISDSQLDSGEPFLLITEESSRLIKSFCEQFSVEGQLRNPTKWVKSLIEDIDNQRKKENELKERHRYDFWYAPRHEQAVPFNVSKANEKRVLRILDSLDKSLYKIEGGIRSGAKYLDQRNNLDWRLDIGVPLGRFMLTIQDEGGKLTLAFSRDRNLTPLVVCADSKSARIEEQLGDALYTLCIEAGKAANEQELKHRRYLRRENVQRWQRRMDETKSADAEHRIILETFLGNHAFAKQVRGFVASLEAVIEQTQNPEEIPLLLEMKTWAEQYADDKDPFVRSASGKDPADVWQLAAAIRDNELKRQELLRTKPEYDPEEAAKSLRQDSSSQKR